MLTIRLHKIKKEFEIKLMTKIFNDIQFKRFTPEYEQQLATTHGNIPFKTILSMRCEYITDLIIKNHHKVIPKILHGEIETSSITVLSEKYKLPPIALLKISLSKNGYSAQDIHNILHEIPTSQPITDVYRRQVNEAIANDGFTIIDNKQQLANSLNFEKDIQNILENLGVTYKTQDELTAEQIKTHGKPISTPDFLITSNLTINGRKIHWIDAKNYYLSCFPFTVNKIKGQTKKYIDLYGYGAIIASCGVCDDLKVNGVMMIPYDDIVEYGIRSSSNTSSNTISSTVTSINMDDISTTDI